MNPERAAELAAIGQLIAAAAAVFGLGFVGWQVRSSRRSGDLTALQKFLSDCREREHGLYEAPEGARGRRFYELLDHFEVYAAAYNHKLIERVSRGLVREKLRDSVATIEMAPQWHGHVETAVTSESTYKELALFIRKERNAINSLISKRRAESS